MDDDSIMGARVYPRQPGDSGYNITEAKSARRERSPRRKVM